MEFEYGNVLCYTEVRRVSHNRVCDLKPEV
jgi:hypothetical protein